MEELKTISYRLSIDEKEKLNKLAESKCSSAAKISEEIMKDYITNLSVEESTEVKEINKEGNLKNVKSIINTENQFKDCNLSFLTDKELSNMAKKYESDLIQAKIEIENNLKSNFILIPATPEQIEVHNSFTEQYKKNDNNFNPINILFDRFKESYFWDNLPKNFNNSSWKTAINNL